MTTPETASTYAYRFLQEFADVLQPALDRALSSQLGPDWPDKLAASVAARSKAKPPKYTRHDTSALLAALTEKSYLCFPTLNASELGRVRGCASEIRALRNEHTAMHNGSESSLTMRNVRRLSENGLIILDRLGVPLSSTLADLCAEIEEVTSLAPDTARPFSRTMLDVLQTLAGGRPLQLDGHVIEQDAATESFLLPQVDYFVGREDKIAELLELLHPETNVSYVIIDGPGGIGKSAIAAQAVDRIKTAKLYRKILWLTAKDSYFDHEGQHDLEPDASSLHDLLVRIVQTLGNVELQAAQSLGPRDLMASARKLLSETSTLLIVDNLETLQGDAIHTFLERQLPKSTKALVTSRIRRWAGTRVQVAGLLADHVSQLLTTLIAERRGISVQLEAALVVRVTEWSGGVPLAILWLLAKCAYDVERLRLTVENTSDKFDEDLLQFCFDGLADDLESVERQILSLLAMFPSPLLRDRIARIVGTPSAAQVPAALDRLEQMSLAVGDEQYRFTVLPLSRRFIKVRAGEWQDEHDFVTRAVRAYVEDVTSRYGNEPPSVEFLQDELLNLSSVFDLCEARGYWDLVVTLTRAISEHLGAVGNSDERLRFGQAGARAAGALGDRDSQAWFLAFDVAWVLLHRGHADNARDTWQFLLDDESVTDPRVKAMCLKNLALHHRMVALAGPTPDLVLLQKAEELALESVRRWDALGDEHWSTTTRATLGSVLLAAGSLSKARELYEQTYEVHSRNGHSEGRAISASKLAQVLMRMGGHDDLIAAEAFLREAESIDRRLGRKQGLAGHLERRAQLCVIRDDPEAAKDLLRAAAQVHRDIKSWSRLRRVEQELAALE